MRGCFIQRRLCPLPGRRKEAEAHSTERCSPRHDLCWLSNGCSLINIGTGCWPAAWTPTQQGPQVRENAIELHNEAR